MEHPSCDYQRLTEDTPWCVLLFEETVILTQPQRRQPFQMFRQSQQVATLLHRFTNPYAARRVPTAVCCPVEYYLCAALRVLCARV